VFDKRDVGYSIGDRMAARLAVDAVAQALARGGPCQGVLPILIVGPRFGAAITRNR